MNICESFGSRSPELGSKRFGYTFFFYATFDFLNCLVRKKQPPPFAEWWKFGRALLKHIGLQTLVALSPDYESETHQYVNLYINHLHRLPVYLSIETNVTKAYFINVMTQMCHTIKEI